MKKSGGDRLKYAVYESTRAPLRGPPSPMDNAIKLSGKSFLAPHRGSSPKGRGGYVAVLHESVGISIALDYST